MSELVGGLPPSFCSFPGPFRGADFMVKGAQGPKGSHTPSFPTSLLSSLGGSSGVLKWGYPDPEDPVPILLQVHEIQSVSPSVQLFVTLWTIARQDPLLVFSRHEYWSGLPFPSRGDLPDPRD